MVLVFIRAKSYDLSWFFWGNIPIINRLIYIMRIFRKKINLIVDTEDSFTLFKNLRLNALTLEDGEITDISLGEIYLGRDVEDIGEKGISHLKEIGDILYEMELDKKILPIGELTLRLNKLAVRISEGKGEFKKQENKMKGIALINKFRRSIGLHPIEYEKYMKKLTLIQKVFLKYNRYWKN